MRTLHVLMMVVAMACNPVIFRVYEAEGRAAAEPLIRRQGELLLGLALPAAIGFIMLAPAIAVGHAWRGISAGRARADPVDRGRDRAERVPGILSVPGVLLPKQPLQQTCVFVAGALVNVALNFLLIPRFGLIGAALATVAAYALIMAGSLLVGRRLYPLPFSVIAFWKILTGCAALALILWPVRDSTERALVILHGLAGAIAYAMIVCSLDVASVSPPL